MEFWRQILVLGPPVTGPECKLGERPSGASLGDINCDDEEDCIQGSGSGDGTHPGGDYRSRDYNTGSNDNGGTSSNPSGGTKYNAGEDWDASSDSKWALNPLFCPFTLLTGFKWTLGQFDDMASFAVVFNVNVFIFERTHKVLF